MSHGNWNEGLISSNTILSLLFTLTSERRSKNSLIWYQEQDITEYYSCQNLKTTRLDTCQFQLIYSISKSGFMNFEWSKK